MAVVVVVVVMVEWSGGPVRRFEAKPVGFIISTGIIIFKMMGSNLDWNENGTRKRAFEIREPSTYRLLGTQVRYKHV